MVWENESKLVRQSFVDRLDYFLNAVRVCFVLLILFLFYIQVIRGNYFYKLSEQNTAQLYVERSPRGIIYDCNENIICRNRPVSRVLLYPFKSYSGQQLLKDQLLKVGALLPKIRIDPSWYNSKNIICLAENIPLEDMFKLMEQRNNLPNIFVVMEQRRYYPYSETASHVLGYIAEIDNNQLAKLKQEGYKSGDIIGKAGIEKEYDAYLKGKSGGLLVETDASGKQLSILRKIDPEIGNSLRLTIDINLQKIAEEELKKTGCAGAVVAIDPKNGAVKVLASSPGYDPNVFAIYSGAFSGVDYRHKYLGDNSLPLFNRAIQGRYTPGSVFKIITSLAALDGKGIDPSKTYYCPGYFNLGRKTFKCWKKEGHGTMSFLTGLKNSCDVYFYNIGLDVGVDMIVDYARKFHLSETTRIDMPSENAGFLPTTAWRTKKIAWYNGDTVNLSIGQGYLIFTPVELACFMSAVANKGTIWQPYIVDEIYDSRNSVIIKKTEPRKVDNVEISEYAWKLLEEGLFNVVDSGTGYGAHINGLKIAGKTGTAQNPLGKDHALFLAYAPVGDPKIALVVVVEHGGMGGAVAAPIAGRILQEAFKNQINKDSKIAVSTGTQKTIESD